MQRDEIIQKIADGESLSRANLDGANLDGANLTGANLCGANLTGATLPTGETWAQYLDEVVPALCIAGGVPLEIVASEWNCHTWRNCPMARAFSVNSLTGVPPLLRPRVEQFIQLFDAGLIPNPLEVSNAD
jgi:hypothetical protein